MRMMTWLPLSSKSNDGYSSSKLVKFIRPLGYRNVFIKSYNESAILALTRRVRDDLKDAPVAPAESIPYVTKVMFATFVGA
jgi:hypothetical protein